MSDAEHRLWLAQAVDLALENVRAGGRPFGAVLVRDGAVVGTGVNRMMATGDPSSHAEMEALRQAGPALGTVDLSGSVLYASGHPCPMCLAAAVMARVSAVYYAFSNADAEPYGFASTAAYQTLGVTLDPPPLPLTQLDVPRWTAADLYGV
ncbi:nucleoside deaminase [Brevundimonas sp.]|uniref:nucleoside deaminase n=1 Tax=Brevundimonas sp. TaxID=1871086 RepID=UPI00289E248D|nr:nucleoside deaminase [Brevundimonas sp.]